MMKYYWLIIIILFGIKLLKGKELSSYTVKWMWAYVIYLLWLQEESFYHTSWSSDDAYVYIVLTFIIPLGLYLIFPFIWKFLSRWRLFKWIEDKVDRWYDVIKSKC